MARFYTIQLDTIYLTDTGLVGGNPCKLDIPNASDIIDGFAQNPVVGNDGQVKVQNFAQINGKVFTINITRLTKAVWESLLSLRTTALGSSATITVIGTGDVGNFDIEAIPLKFTASQFINERIKDVSLQFVSVSQN